MILWYYDKSKTSFMHAYSIMSYFLIWRFVPLCWPSPSRTTKLSWDQNLLFFPSEVIQESLPKIIGIPFEILGIPRNDEEWINLQEKKPRPEKIILQ